VAAAEAWRKGGGGDASWIIYDDGLQEEQATKRKKINYFLYNTLHAKRLLKYCPILSGKTLRSFIHPDLQDFYVGFCWFTGQIVHFLAAR
jgi:hypothetical protein